MVNPKHSKSVLVSARGYEICSHLALENRLTKTNFISLILLALQSLDRRSIDTLLQIGFMEKYRIEANPELDKKYPPLYYKDFYRLVAQYELKNLYRNLNDLSELLDNR